MPFLGPRLGLLRLEQGGSGAEGFGSGRDRWRNWPSRLRLAAKPSVRQLSGHTTAGGQGVLQTLLKRATKLAPPCNHWPWPSRSRPGGSGTAGGKGLAPHCGFSTRLPCEIAKAISAGLNRPGGKHHLGGFGPCKNAFHCCTRTLAGCVDRKSVLVWLFLLCRCFQTNVVGVRAGCAPITHQQGLPNLKPNGSQVWRLLGACGFGVGGRPESIR